MKKIENDYWSDLVVYYILYQDKYFMKSIYAQLFEEFPDVGQIAYIGTNTRKFSKDYSINGENFSGEDLNKNIEEKKDRYNQNIKQDNAKKAGIGLCDSVEESEIREYANIHEIKEMNNFLFYKQMLRKIVLASFSKKLSNICHIKGRINMYDKFKEKEDVFIKMDNSCIWLKKSYMDTTAMNMAHLLGDVHVVGFILEEETKTTPRIIKAIAIYT